MDEYNRGYTVSLEKKKTRLQTLVKNVKRDKCLLLLVLPTVLCFIIFSYIPMCGLSMAFVNYLPGRSIFNSPWVGFKWFKEFIDSFYFIRLMRNTFLISLYSLIFSFPIPIIFALMLNEIRKESFKRVVQTVSYLPHFISLVVVVGMMFNFLDPNGGVINRLIIVLGGNSQEFMTNPAWFRTLFVSSGIWQEFGWSSIIYLAALTSIDPQIYEAAKMDGAGRWKQMWHVTLPGITPTIVILLILNIGGLMSVGFEKVILMYNPSTYETADVISTYVYRRGILSGDFSFATAIGLFNSVICFIFLYAANRISKKFSEIALF